MTNTNANYIIGITIYDNCCRKSRNDLNKILNKYDFGPFFEYPRFKQVFRRRVRIQTHTHIYFSQKQYRSILPTCLAGFRNVEPLANPY